MMTLEAILSRRTSKVLVDPDKPWPAGNMPAGILEELTLAAEMAPVHYPSHRSHRDGDAKNSALPWRLYRIDSRNCRELLNWMQRREIDGGKILSMLAAADMLFIVTWLPNPPRASTVPGESVCFDATLENMEHIAAASAAIQNTLIAATDRGILNYWSSGGILRQPEIAQILGIGDREILLGALFFFPGRADFPSPPMEVAPGKMRDQKGPRNGWVCDVTLLSAQ